MIPSDQRKDLILLSLAQGWSSSRFIAGFESSSEACVTDGLKSIPVIPGQMGECEGRLHYTVDIET